MPLDTSQLRQVLSIENARHNDNKSVIGGLDRYLKNWVNHNLILISNPKLVKAFSELYPADFSYASLSIEKRWEWISRLINLLSEIETVQKIPRDTVKKTERNIKKVERSYIKSSSRVNDSKCLEAPITDIKGISTALSSKFAKLGIKSIHDLLYFFPHRHLNYSQIVKISQLTEGDDQTIEANVWEVHQTFIGSRRSTEAIIGDESGNMRVIWFNNPWVLRQLHAGDHIVISGRVKYFQGRPVFESPEWEIVEDKELIHTGRLVPVYPLTSGLYQRQVRKLVKAAIDQYAGLVSEYIPRSILGRCNLLDLSFAISQYHFPETLELKDKARVRLAFNELFLLQLGVIERKRHWQMTQPGVPMKIDADLLSRFEKTLSFRLTAAQNRVISEITGDMSRSIPMSRLLQGEVGSGKTIVALMALLIAASNGYQGALMAPTEILARQHLATMRTLLSVAGHEEIGDNVYQFSGIINHSLTVALLTGDMNISTKRDLKKVIAAGKVDIVLGTHALIQKGVSFHKLGLVIVDEQHRFGVEQRSLLRQKGFNPHMLVMTATPIPRTLALTIYGDLDLSVIDELPAGRQLIKTKWLKPPQRDSAYHFIRKQVKEGHQAFIICPLVEESESIQARAATAEFERLAQEIFPDLRLGLLHGRMTAKEKDEIMSAFKCHEFDILVSTPVVEVGIDVPNATVMLVESADRFGLSQLHQFRGRVGRGANQSYCMFIADNPSDIGYKRLDIIEHTYDGFQLADEDLKLRGPGEFFGTRQSGLPELKMAKLSDVSIMEMAREEASNLYKQYPDLSQFKSMVDEMNRIWPGASGEWS